MSPQTLPELRLPLGLELELQDMALSIGSVEEAEDAARDRAIERRLRESALWAEFGLTLRSAVQARGFAVVRGLSPDQGRSLLVASSALGLPFMTYGRSKVVKRFRLSPWTRKLSHSLEAGDFHTDGNVAAAPPAATVMQCEVEDPGGAAFAEQRVAYLPDLLRRLVEGSAADREALTFLTEREAAMAHEGSPALWRGRLVEGETIRYHPESLRVAQRRLGTDGGELETAIGAIHRAAMDVSAPFHTRPGDTLFVSNRTALHYRGACSVRFVSFPVEFEARSLLVLHLEGATA